MALDALAGPVSEIKPDTGILYGEGAWFDAGDEATTTGLVCCKAMEEPDWPAVVLRDPVTTPLGPDGKLLGPPYGGMRVFKD